jgi:hypothetical protein
MRYLIYSIAARTSTEDFVYRCVVRECNVRLYVPVNGNYDNNLELINQTGLKNISFDGSHTCSVADHTKLYDIKGRDGIDLKTEDISIETQKHDFEFLKAYIMLSPFRSVNTIYSEMIIKNQVFTKEEIRKTLNQIRNDLYPNDNFLAFTKKFCQCLDFKDSGMSLFQAYIN